MVRILLFGTKSIDKRQICHKYIQHHPDFGFLDATEAVLPASASGVWRTPGATIDFDLLEDLVRAAVIAPVVKTLFIAAPAATQDANGWTPVPHQISGALSPDRLILLAANFRLSSPTDRPAADQLADELARGAADQELRAALRCANALRRDLLICKIDDPFRLDAILGG